MKVKKTVTERVVKANQEAAKSSTGPRTNSGPMAPKYNATKLGLLSKRLLFRSEDDRKDFDKLLAQLIRETQPADTLERMAVVEIATKWWRHQECLQWEDAAMRARRTVTVSAIRGCAAQSVEFMDAAGLNVFDDAGVAREDPAEAWDCTQLVLSSGHDAGRSEKRWGIHDEWISKGNRNVLGITLTSSLEKVMRYSASAKRDLYRAMDLLVRLQAREKE